MSASSKAALYTPDILALATELAAYPFRPDAPHMAEVRSRTCGSTVMLSCEVAGDALVAPGLRVSACAIGQAAAAIFASDAAGRSRSDLQAGEAGLVRWLGGEDAMPDWPRLAALERARGYPARHEAILLPWRAAIAALSLAGPRV